MRTIRKGAEPNSLVQHRHLEGAYYENYGDKDELRDCLVQEQRGLCCYCMKMIRAEQGGMKIEHWHSQTGHIDEQLRYSNFLGACMGGEGTRFTEQHCDTRKGDRDLSRNPANPLHHVDDSIQFLGDGTVESSDPLFDRELNEVLNLNLPFLRNNRKAVLDAFKQGLAMRGHLSRAVLQRWLQDWNGDSDPGALRPYCQVVVYWLRKRLARA